MSKNYLITGANGGLGLDATRQLALREDVAKVYMTCRSQEKAEAAMATLAEHKDKLEFVKFDAAASKADIEKAASALPKGVVLDGMVLNAGGIGHDTTGKPSAPNNILPIVQINLAGHVHLVEYFLKRGNIAKNNKTRIINIGTEAARGIPFMMMPPAKFEGDTPDYFKTYLDGSVYKKYDPMGAYGEIKGLATLYFSAWARVHPDVYVITTSPGGTKGTDFASQEAMNSIMSKIFPVAMKAMAAVGWMHDVDVGAKRYVDAVTGEGEYSDYKTGSFVASKSGVAGPVADQVEQFPKTGKQFGDVKKQDAAYAAVNQFL